MAEIVERPGADPHPAEGPATAAFRSARDLLLDHRGEYLAAYRQFRWPRLEHFNWAFDWFDVLATEQPDTMALRILEPDGSEQQLTYAQMAARSSQVASWLRGEGVGRGDRILLALPNTAALWETTLAAMRLGAVIIPATTMLGPADLADRVGRGHVRHVVTTSDQTPKLDGIDGGWTRIAVGSPVPGWLRYDDSQTHLGHVDPQAPTRGDDTLLLYFTSGTTASPKLVTHTHVSYPVGHLSTMYWIGLRPGDVHLNISSPGWAKHAWSNVFAPWNAGATVLVVNQPRFAAADLLNAMERTGVSTFCAPPTVWRLLIQENLGAWRLPIRELVAAGEPLNPEVVEQVQRVWGITVRDGFGQTETTALVGNTPDQPVRPGSMGRALPGYDVVLVDPVTGQVGEEGEIALSLASPTLGHPLGLMGGYRDDEDRTSQAMAGGVYHTGDVARRDPDGYITYVGRADDVFKASDYRISPFELESVLIEHPAVAEAAVVPSPDPVRLAVPKAYVTLTAGHEPNRETAESILRFARERLAAYKRVRRLEFAELPKTVSGKIRRVDLRGRETELHGLTGQVTLRSDLEFWEEDFPDLKTSPDPGREGSGIDERGPEE
ncbi:MAG: AMP-binding protein [Actinomycetes bacterium]